MNKGLALKNPGGLPLKTRSPALLTQRDNLITQAYHLGALGQRGGARALERTKAKICPLGTQGVSHLACLGHLNPLLDICRILGWLQPLTRTGRDELV